jgi:hypothetical protein
MPADCKAGQSRNLDNPVIYTEMVDAITVSGTVYNDIDGASNGINNLSWASLPGMKAILVDGSGNVAAITPVDGFGVYSFTGIDPVNTFKVMLSTTSPTIGSQAPATATLPAGWASTGENIGTGTGNDGTPNGISTPFSPPGIRW